MIGRLCYTGLLNKGSSPECFKNRHSKSTAFLSEIRNTELPQLSSRLLLREKKIQDIFNSAIFNSVSSAPITIIIVA